MIEIAGESMFGDRTLMVVLIVLCAVLGSVVVYWLKELYNQFKESNKNIQLILEREVVRDKDIEMLKTDVQTHNRTLMQHGEILAKHDEKFNYLEKEL
ncbi:MAG: hypothetical protein LBO69_02190 [Ignavibacteria bacterium]|jgi:Na+-transporting NADH:ubiquinone oxidoreductase subunit NqrC|nr:hypothetical protein [Ignavibacteria bacterium]